MAKKSRAYLLGPVLLGVVLCLIGASVSDAVAKWSLIGVGLACVGVTFLVWLFLLYLDRR